MRAIIERFPETLRFPVPPRRSTVEASHLAALNSFVVNQPTTCSMEGLTALADSVSP